MNIGVDLERMRTINSGLGQFCLHLATELLNQKEDADTLHFYYPKGYTNLFDTPYSHVTELDKITGIRAKHDLFYCSHQDSHLFPWHVPTVMTIHDLNFLEKYKSASRRRAKLRKLQRKVNRSKGLIFITEYTRRIAENNLVIPNIPVQVIHNGNCLWAFDPATKPIGIPDGEFLFAIGIINPKKNFHTLLPLVEATGLPLVISGIDSHPYAQSIKTMAQTMGIGHRVFFTGPVTDPEKYWLYTHCKAFLFPSLAEGFGMPVIEAMSVGKPVFCSDKTSLPEVGGPLANFWWNFEKDHMVQVYHAGMAAFESDPEMPQKLKQWASAFTWPEAARKYLQFYKLVYDNLRS